MENTVHTIHSQYARRMFIRMFKIYTWRKNLISNDVMGNAAGGF